MPCRTSSYADATAAPISRSVASARFTCSMRPPVLPLAHLEHREQPPRVRGQVDESERPVVQEIDAEVGERADVLFPELEQA